MGAIQSDRKKLTKDYIEKDLNCIDKNHMFGLPYSNAIRTSLLNNKFDPPDRLFSRIDILWENSFYQNNKELIPEFYYIPKFLKNINFFDFGTSQTKSRVSDVELPKWVITQTAEAYQNGQIRNTWILSRFKKIFLYFEK